MTKTKITVKSLFLAFVKIVAVLLAVLFLLLFVVRAVAPLLKSSTDFTADRDYDLTGAIQEVPAQYFEPVKDGGTLEEVYYETPLAKKRAIIYLPPGYDSRNQYDIIYFQGGANATEKTYFGTPDDPKPRFGNMLDHMIINGEIKPMIAVCANFYHKPRSETDMTELSSLYQNYTAEVRDCLIPAVESRYSTFAASTNEQDLIASREHRAFGGYSMGAAITWNMFMENLDYFYYFIPNCGGMQNPYVPHLTTDAGDRLNASLEKSGYTKDDFFIYSVVGTLDITYNSTRCLIHDLRHFPQNFVFTRDNTKNGNITFKKKNFKVHSFTNATTYFYNALPAVFDGA